MFTLGSCMHINRDSLKKDSLLGNYINEKPSLLECCLHPFYHYLFGRTLTISADSTFSLEFCTTVCKGFWKVKQDSLILTLSSCRPKKDTTSSVSTERYSYKIRDNGELYSVFKGSKSGIKSHDYFVRVKK